MQFVARTALIWQMLISWTVRYVLYRNIDIQIHILGFLHTGGIESVNSMTTLRYMPKSHSYKWPGMIIRSILGMFCNHKSNLS